MRGGAEKVLRVLAEMFPDAPIYTLLYDEAKLGTWFPKERVRTSDIQHHYPLSIIHHPFFFNHHFYLRRFPAAVEAWDFSEFDLVISSSSAFAHGIITNGKPKHLCYVHSPARYLWDRSMDVLSRAGRGPLGPLKKCYLSRTFHKLREWDAEVSDRPDYLLAASKTVQRRIELYWRRESAVVPPPIDDFWLQDKSILSSSVLRPTSYFFIASTLVPYKRIDLAIEASNRAKLPLLIAGEGRDRRRLESLAGPTVAFLGYKDETALRELYAGATATIFPGDEDFGLVPLESLACGTPVIAYQSGGSIETLTEGVTASFFDEPTAASLQNALEHFERKNFSPDDCRTAAKRHARTDFEEAIRREVEALRKV